MTESMGRKAGKEGWLGRTCIEGAQGGRGGEGG